MTPGHQDLGAEARALLEVLSAKLEQAATSADIATDTDTDTMSGPHDATRCTGCPVCAAMTYLRDHRELSTQLAHGALIIVGAVRQYLDQTAPAGTARPSSASVQHIDIS